MNPLSRGALRQLRADAPLAQVGPLRFLDFSRAVPRNAPDPMRTIGVQPMQVAGALLRQGSTHGTTLETLARTLGVKYDNARRGMAAALDLARRASVGDASGIDDLRLAPDLERLLSPGDTFDSAAVRYVSRVAPVRAGATWGVGDDAGADDFSFSGPPLPESMAPTIGNGVAYQEAQKLVAKWMLSNPPSEPSDYGKSGEFDGIAGARSKKAFAKFQRAVGFVVRQDGILDQPTLSHLRDRVARIEQNVSLFDPAPVEDFPFQGPPSEAPTIPNGASYKEGQRLVALYFTAFPFIADPPDFGSSLDLDGLAGPRSRRAFKAFQAQMGFFLRQDGVLDETTLAMLREETAGFSGGVVNGRPLLSDRASILEAQQLVAGYQRRNPPKVPPGYGDSSSDFDGIIGQRTTSALASFQSRKGLTHTDGKLDGETLAALRADEQTAPVGPGPAVTPPLVTPTFPAPPAGDFDEPPLPPPLQDLPDFPIPPSNVDPPPPPLPPPSPALNEGPFPLPGEGPLVEPKPKPASAGVGGGAMIFVAGVAAYLLLSGAKR